MKRSMLLISLLLIASPANALPDAPKPKQDRKWFILGASALAGAKTFDAVATRNLIDRGGWENDPLLGRHPSNARLVGVNFGFFAAETAGFWLTEHSSHKWVRWAGRASLGLMVEQHIKYGVCDLKTNPNSPVVQNCRAW